MDSTLALDATRVVSAIAVLGVASVLDWRSRKVQNAYWIVLALLGLALMIAQILIDEQDPAYALVLIPIAAILADVYLDLEGDRTWARIAPYVKYAIALTAVVILAYLWGNDAYFQHLLAVPVFMLFVVLLYFFDVLRGGADAKALMSLAIVFPFYPVFDSIPVLRAELSSTETLFPFGFIVLVTAAIIVALFPLAFLAVNLARGDRRLPYALLGYRMPTSDVPGKHVWLMERVKDGKHDLRTRPIRTDDVSLECRRLSEAGFSNVWVTPKIPFIIPMLAGLIIATVAGNLLLLLFPI